MSTEMWTIDVNEKYCRLAAHQISFCIYTRMVIHIILRTRQVFHAFENCFDDGRAMK